MGGIDTLRRLAACISIALLALVVALPAGAQDAARGRFEPTPCPFVNNGSYPIECGWLHTPEDHHNPAGKTIKLAVAIIRSPNPQKAPDPVLYVAGGPGGAFVATASRLPYMFGLSSLLRERDVVVMDQRGMGLSQPRIACIPFDSAVDFFQPTFPPDGFYERIQGCRREIAAQGINPELYNAEQNAADFAALRRALGYEQVNLYGTSWGTYLEQLILRDHPQGVRSALLDSTLPVNQNAFEGLGYVFEASWAEFGKTCQADVLCRATYPNLRPTYLETYERLRVTPVQLTVSGQTIWLTGQSFASGVYMLLRDKAGIERLPGFITSVAHGDYSVFTPGVKAILQTERKNLPDQGPFLTMGCAQHAATTSLTQIETKRSAYPAAVYNADLFFGPVGYRMCAAWGMPAPASTVPVVSAVPTLILAGQFDPLTPPAWGRQVALGLRNGQVVEFPYLGHGSGSDACAQSLMVQFLENPSARPANTCTATIAAPSFAVTADVTRPFVRTGAWLMAAIALFGLGSAARTFSRRQHQLAWRASLRKLGWLPVAASGLVMIVLWIIGDQLFSDIRGVSIVQMVIPLVMAMQAAAIFPPDDEPGLEMLLALPRPISWLVVERLALVFITQTAIALLGVGLTLAFKPGQDVGMLLFSWLPSAMFLSGLALYVTLRTRLVLLGVVVAAFLWMILGLFYDFFLPGGSYNFPLNIVQPFLWAIHLHISPADFQPADFWLNRLFMAGLGIVLMMLALREVRSPEQLLLNTGRKARRKAEASAPENDQRPASLRSAVHWHSVQIALNPISQLVGIAWYEFKMHARRRAFKVLTFTMVLGVSVVMLIMRADFMTRLIPGMPPLELLPPDQLELMKGLMLVTSGAALISAVVILFLPLVVAETVPLDHQQHMSEQLDSLPLRSPVYLAGKVVGVWLASGSSLVVSTVIIAGLWWLHAGTYNLLPLLSLLLTGALPVMLPTSAFAVLVGATQPSRRRAVMVLLGVMAALLLLPSLVFVNTPLEYLLPGRMVILNHYVGSALEAMLHLPPAMPASGFTVPEVSKTLVVGLGQVVLAALVGWGLRRFKRV